MRIDKALAVIRFFSSCTFGTCEGIAPCSDPCSLLSQFKLVTEQTGLLLLHSTSDDQAPPSNLSLIVYVKVVCAATCSVLGFYCPRIVGSGRLELWSLMHC